MIGCDWTRNLLYLSAKFGFLGFPHFFFNFSIKYWRSYQFLNFSLVLRDSTKLWSFLLDLDMMTDLVSTWLQFRLSAGSFNPNLPEIRSSSASFLPFLLSNYPFGFLLLFLLDFLSKNPKIIWEILSRSLQYFRWICLTSIRGHSKNYLGFSGLQDFEKGALCQPCLVFAGGFNY